VTHSVQTGRLLVDYDEERIQWRSMGRVARGKITVLDGDPGLGKSTLLIDWAAKVSRGDPLPDGDPSPEKGVILLSAEDDPSDTIRPRFEVAGGDPSQVLILNEIPKRNADGDVIFDQDGDPMMKWMGFPDDARLLRAAIEAMDAGLVIIDPLMSYLSPDVKSNSDQDIRRALSPLALIAQETGVSIIIVRHLNNSGGVNALYRGGGSIGIIGMARIGLLLGRSKQQPHVRVLASVKNNISQPAPSLGFILESVTGSDVARMQYIGEVAETANDLLLGDVTSDEDQDEGDEATEWLKNQLKDGPRESSQILKDARSKNLSERAVRRAKTKLKVKARPGAYQGAWTWELPVTVSFNSNGHVDIDEDEVVF
jgi:RecA-family ATPase